MRILKLEAIRGFVALYILIHHFILFTPLDQVTPASVTLFFYFGREAVLVFFLLSGFVICLAMAKNKEMDFYTYFSKRFLRIYPILLVTFLISAVVFYLNGYIFSYTDFKSLLANIFQLQRIQGEPPVNVPAFLGNLPLWSLGYEWWFYMLFFPLYLLFRKYKKQLIIKDIYWMLGLSAISWTGFLYSPSHFLLILNFFLLWWSGFYCAEIYLEKGNFSFHNLKPVLISLLVMSLVMGLPVVKAICFDHKTLAEVNADYPVTVYLYNFVEAFILLILGLIWWKFNLYKFNSLFGWFARFSPISYALYVIHFPILLLNVPFIENIYLLTLFKFIIIFIFSYFLEISFQPWVLRSYKSLSVRLHR
ncbi:acyltransferase family protein [Pedobacter cryoconitis]|uniref:Peptidoglycan/LPS O-acetylase OafA/YrhL n=1 Tax=Pedobacter cryoconitis TaxID=188932 RepID=A0A7X0MGI0_9SPHI|nr:acyltransferase [Pedobacter cryoconitis]MBB6498109.1 peptidoglycan/LPS O-acetylase OafA/YrhL [Pedobacter cryoconitis]